MRDLFCVNHPQIWDAPYQRVNDIVNSQRGITPSTALRLAKLFDLSPDFWMNVQMRWEIYFAQQEEADSLVKIDPLETHAG